MYNVGQLVVVGDRQPGEGTGAAVGLNYAFAEQQQKVGTAERALS